MDAPSVPSRTAACTGGALLLFATNSLLCRGALESNPDGAPAFTAVRLLSGAVMLLVLARLSSPAPAIWKSARISSAAWLFAYAACFSYSYLRIDAGVGALILFGAVQATMIGSGLVSGERPRITEWLGVAVALAGLVVLTRPGQSAPDAMGAGLMILAGIAWGAYSLAGRSVTRPLDATAGNFALTLVPVAILILATRSLVLDSRGVLLATLSGAVASGLGYTLWYAALRGLTATRAAILQLSVPVIAAAAAVALLDETVTSRLVGSGAAILGGVALAMVGRRQRVVEVPVTGD